MGREELLLAIGACFSQNLQLQGDQMLSLVSVVTLRQKRQICKSRKGCCKFEHAVAAAATVPIDPGGLRFHQDLHWVQVRM